MEEIDALRTALEKPQRPTAAVVGGAKVSTKIPVLTNLMAKVDKLIIGGGMANTFLLAQGMPSANRWRSRTRWHRARDHGRGEGQGLRRSCCRSMASSRASSRPGAASRVVDVGQVPADRMMLDVGPQSVAHLSKVLRGSAARCCGTARSEPSRSRRSARARSRWRGRRRRMTKAGRLVSVAGGGDTVAALTRPV